MNIDAWINFEDWRVGVLTILIMGAYFVYAHFEAQVIKDERETLIEMKSITFSRNCMFGVVILNYFLGDRLGIDARHVGTWVIAAYLAGEVLGKLYYRWRI